MAQRTGAGKYNRRLPIEQPTKTTAADGQRTTSWTAYATLWAAQEPLEGDESHERQRLTTEQKWRFVVRSSTTSRAVTTRMRIRLADGTILNVASVRDIKAAKREVEIVAELSKQ